MIFEQVLTYLDFLCPFTRICLVTLVVGLINLINVLDIGFLSVQPYLEKNMH